MREKKLIFDAEPCDTNLYPDGPATVANAKSEGKSFCPHYEKCKQGALHPKTGYQCTMLFGVQVTRFALKERHSIEAEMQDFRKEAPYPSKGYLWSSDRKTFEVIMDHEEAMKKVQKFANMVFGDVTTAPDGRKVGDSFGDVVAYATTPEGHINLAKTQELEGRFGYNAGRGCDVRRGPCSCGAWH